MTTNFAIDSNNGFLVQENQLVLVNDKESIAINCQTLSQTIQSEEPFFQDVGIEYFETLWEGSANIPDFERSLRDTLNSIEGVVYTNNFLYEIENNTLNYQIDILTIFGTTTIGNTLNV